MPKQKKSQLKKPKMIKIMENPKYKGMHVIFVNNKIYTAKTGRKAARILKELRKKYPDQTPQITYVPKANTFL